MKDLYGGTAPAEESRRPVVVVTGASAGVGRATALAFAKRGFDVALLARGQAGLEAAAKEVESQGARALPLVVDVAHAEDVERCASAVETELGPIDVWVNNAMTTVFAPFTEIGPEEFQRALEVTFLGQVWGTKAALSRMRARDRGHIVNAGSALSFVGIPLQSAYCSAKFACRGFFESVRAELIHEGSHVRLSMVHMPALNTPQFGWCKSVFDRYPEPVPPIYQPELAADAIVSAAISGKRSKILGSWNKMLVVMDTAFPGLGNQYAAIAAWGSQLTNRQRGHDRAFNLWDPMDASDDHGAHGMFDDRAGGVLDLSFLKSLPKTGLEFARAIARATRDRTA